MKIPVSELRILIQLFSVMEARISEVTSELREAGGRMVHSIEAGPTWAHLYDLPFREHMVRAAVAFGIDREVVAATQSALPMSAFRDLIADFEGADIDLEDVEKDQAMQLAWAALGTSYSLYSSMRSLLTFGLYINELLAAARERSDDKALLNAVRIDPTVLCSRTGAVRLSRATLERDKRFIGAVQRALSGC